MQNYVQYTLKKHTTTILLLFKAHHKNMKFTTLHFAL